MTSLFLALLLTISSASGFSPAPLTRNLPVGTTSTSHFLTAIQEGELLVHESVVDGRMVKLNAAVRSFNTSEASHLLQELQSIRESSTDPDAVNTVLDEMMSSHANLPMWCCIRYLTRFSSRARLASLHRALDLMTPPPSDGEDSDPQESLSRRRRRALLGILRTLEQPAVNNGFSDRKVAIRQIEKRAYRESKRTKLPASDMIARRPEGLETPKYTVVSERRGYEIRKYEPYSVCTVSMGMDREANPRFDAKVSEPTKGNVKAFGALAGYLFGKNKANTAMKMTTPVLTTEDKQMSFVLPSEFWKDTTKAPKPLENSGVKVVIVPGGERAVIMFGGYAVNVDKLKQELLGLVRRDGAYEVVPGERPVLAQYNDPFTPPWKRLNEVSVAVQAKK